MTSTQLLVTGGNLAEKTAAQAAACAAIETIFVERTYNKTPEQATRVNASLLRVGKQLKRSEGRGNTPN